MDNLGGGLTVSEFQERLTWSKGANAEDDKAALRFFFGESARVEDGTREQDRRGGDYVVTLPSAHHGTPRGRYFVDAKRRGPGCRRYWKTDAPELTLELWSVVPTGGNPGAVGWALDPSKLTDFVLWGWDPRDTPLRVLHSFPLMRLALERNLERWKKKWGPPGRATTTCGGRRWNSDSLFIPVPAARDAMLEVCTRAPRDKVRAGVVFSQTMLGAVVRTQ